MRPVHHHPTLRRVLRAVLLGSAVLPAAGCSGLTDLANNAATPSGVVDPASFQTPGGALTMYQMAVAQFQRAFVSAQIISGLLTDELETPARAAGSGRAEYPLVDSRHLPEGDRKEGPLYGTLQLVRTYAVQANGALAKYDPAAPAALRGEVLALAGYAEIYLADLYCSGVPLSELEFEGDFVYKPGSSTAEIYRHAITRLDSALVRSADSARILNLARVGRGRALLALGEYAAAARAVAGVPDHFQYQFPVFWLAPNSYVEKAAGLSNFIDVASVSDREGGNGLPYRSSNDPRTLTDPVTTQSRTGVRVTYFPARYGPLDGTSTLPCYGGTCQGGTAPVTVASGVEARLIEAEAALAAGDVTTWLRRLNALRTTGPGMSAGGDTTWAAGIGGVAGLRPLADPGTASARVDVLFAERGYWLSLTASRQGDLRRLIRQYHRRQDQVYPSGMYGVVLSPQSVAQLLPYGDDVTIPVPPQERKTNQLFMGCFNRGA